MSHESEVWDLIAATGFNRHDGSVPDEPTYPYVVRFDATPGRSINGLDHVSDRLDYRFQVTSVGLTADSARIVAQAMQAVLLDVTVTVAGWVSYPIRMVNSRPLQEDQSITLTDSRLHPLYVIDEYLLAAEKE